MPPKSLSVAAVVAKAGVAMSARSVSAPQIRNLFFMQCGGMRVESGQLNRAAGRLVGGKTQSLYRKQPGYYTPQNKGNGRTEVIANERPEGVSRHCRTATDYRV